jgi:hypothetical protein
MIFVCFLVYFPCTGPLSYGIRTFPVKGLSWAGTESVVLHSAQGIGVGGEPRVTYPRTEPVTAVSWPKGCSL